MVSKILIGSIQIKTQKTQKETKTEELQPQQSSNTCQSKSNTIKIVIKQLTNSLEQTKQYQHRYIILRLRLERRISINGILLTPVPRHNALTMHIIVKFFVL